ncbi:neogenin-like protein, partial [Leptotrombidium deliense]
MNTVVKGLQPDTKYYFKIRAKNNKGLGPPSKETVFITLPLVTSSSSSPASFFAATSPGGAKLKGRDLKPPDLWIHHNEQMELKGLDKGPLNADGSLTTTPIPRNSQDYSGNEDNKKSGAYSDGLYDDINKGSISPSDTTFNDSSGRSTDDNTN